MVLLGGVVEGYNVDARSGQANKGRGLVQGVGAHLCRYADDPLVS